MYYSTWLYYKIKIQMNYKQQDRDKILSYLETHSICMVDAIIPDSGAERLRVYPILFELSQEKKIRVLEESEWGAPMKVELIQEA